MDVFLEVIIGFKKKAKTLISILKKIDQKPTEDKEFVYTKEYFIGSDYLIGEHTYGIPNILSWNEGAKLTIGKFCSIADDVKILLGGNHRTDWVSTYPFSAFPNNFPNAINIKGHPATKGDIVIGNDVWIGRGATIMSGVRIGDGAVIGANSLISRDINPYEIIVGNPGKVVRRRFNDNVIDQLLDIKWWDWPIEKINQEVTFICHEDVDLFIRRNL